MRTKVCKCGRQGNDEEDEDNEREKAPAIDEPPDDCARKETARRTLEVLRCDVRAHERTRMGRQQDIREEAQHDPAVERTDRCPGMEGSEDDTPPQCAYEGEQGNEAKIGEEVPLICLPEDGEEFPPVDPPKAPQHKPPHDHRDGDDPDDLSGARVEERGCRHAVQYSLAVPYAQPDE